LILQLLREDFPAEFSKIQKRIEDSERVLGKSANVDLALAAGGESIGAASAIRILFVRVRPDRRLDCACRGAA
jgi:hypothetical protein